MVLIIHPMYNNGLGTKKKTTITNIDGLVYNLTGVFYLSSDSNELPIVVSKTIISIDQDTHFPTPFGKSRK
jgi:hypothetical protein